MERTKLVIATSIDLSAFNAPAIHMISLANGLQDCGFEIVLIVPGCDGPLPLPVNMHHLTMIKTRRLRLRGIPSSLNVLTQLPALWRYRSTDAIYIRTAPMSFVTSIAAKLMGYGRRSIEINGWFSGEFESLGYSSVIRRAAEKIQIREARLATNVRVVTPKLKSLLVSHKVDAAGIEVIGNGTDLAVFHPLKKSACRDELGLARDTRYLVFSGNVAPWQDLATAFKALARLRRNGMDVELIVAGGGSNLATAKRQAYEICGTGAVRFPGPLPPDKVNTILNAGDVAIAPFTFARNIRIGLSPLKIRDYAAAGIPIVTNSLPGLIELGGECWVDLVPCEDADALADGLARFLERSPNQLNEIGGTARAYAQEHFDWKRVAAKVADLIRSER